MFIGYDLDGVLVCDLAIDEKNISVDKIKEYHYAMKPLFIPEGDYFIVTSRPVTDREETLAYIKQFFAKNEPKFVVHNRKPEENRIFFKRDALADIMSKYEVDLFIESEKAVVDILKAYLPSLKTVWFKDFLRRYFS